MTERLSIIRALVSGDNWSVMAVAIVIALFAAAAWIVLSVRQIRTERKETLAKRRRDMRAIGGAADMRDRK